MVDHWDKDTWILKALSDGVYHVDSEGNIWKRVNGKDGSSVRMVKPSTHKPTGRVYFTCTFDGISKSVLVNRVVALALLPNPHNHPDVNHIDGNKANNHPSNLEWASRSENEKHAFRTGLKATRGSQNSNAKLTAAAVLEIRDLAKQSSKLRLIDIAKRYGVSPATIKSIITNKTWTHL